MRAVAISPLKTPPPTTNITLNIPRSDQSRGDDLRCLDSSFNFLYIKFCTIPALDIVSNLWNIPLTPLSLIYSSLKLGHVWLLTGILFLSPLTFSILIFKQSWLLRICTQQHHLLSCPQSSIFFLSALYTFKNNIANFFFVPVLAPLTTNEHSVTNSPPFVKENSNINLPLSAYMATFYVRTVTFNQMKLLTCV